MEIIFDLPIGFPINNVISLLFAILEVLHRPRSDTPLNFYNKNIWQICMEHPKASARLLHPAAMLERWQLAVLSRDILDYYQPDIRIQQNSLLGLLLTKLSLDYC